MGIKFAVEPEGKSEEVVKNDNSHIEAITFRFYDFARLYGIFFFLAVVFGAILTYTVSDYTAETDLVTRYYDEFNPCIFFDHYPANMAGITFMGLMIYCDIFFITLLIILQISQHSICGSLFHSGVGMILAIGEAQFVNVFATNLYAEGYQTGEVTDEETDIIKMHTAFYVIWLFTNMILMLWLLTFLNDFVYKGATSDRSWIGNGVPRWISVLLLFSCFIIVLPVTMIMLEGSFTDSTYESDLLVFATQLTDTFSTRSWHTFPCLAFRLLIGKKLAVQFRFRLLSDQGDNAPTTTPQQTPQQRSWGVIDPERLIAVSHQLIFLMCILAFAFKPLLTVNIDAPLIYAFRETPFNYIFGMFWSFYFCIMTVALSVTVLRERMQEGTRSGHLDAYFSVPVQRRLRVANTVIWLFSIFALNLTLLPQFEFLEIFALVWALSLPVWVLLNVGCDAKHIVICAVWVSLSIGAVYSESIALIQMFLLACLPYLLDDTNDLEILSIIAVGANDHIPVEVEECEVHGKQPAPAELELGPLATANNL